MSCVTAVIERFLKLLRTTAFRLASIYLSIFVLAGLLVAFVLLRQTSAALTTQPLRAIAGDRSELVEIARSRGIAELTAAVAERSKPGSPGLYFLGDSEGHRQAGNIVGVPPELMSAPEGGVFNYVAGGTRRLAAGTRTGVPGGGDLVVARDIEDARQIAEQMRRSFLLGLALLGLAGITGGIFSSRHLLKRIDLVTATSRSIMAGDLSRRIPTTGNSDEIDNLSASLNAMLDRIEQLMAGMREVSDNIAHDLKTPLNRMRNRIESALHANGAPEGHRQGLEHALAEADEIIKTFNALLLIARLEAGAVQESMAPFDVAVLVRDVAELYEPVGEEKGLELRVDVHEPLQILGNKQLIGQAVANLIDNAIKYSSAGDRSAGSQIDVEACRNGAGVEISVADQGPGIAANDRQRALQRFVRLDASRSAPGTGLGLSLVAAVARLHAGSVRLEDNDPGLKVVLTLPCRSTENGVAAGPEPG